MVKNEDFYAKIFMNPIYHASSFLYGIALCLIYNRFCRERGYESALRNSLSSRLMEFFRHNQAPRYVLYLCSLSCMMASIFWQTPFVGKPAEQSQLLNAMFATFAFPLFLAGFSVLLMSALAGRASAFRFFFNTATWNPICNVSVGLYYCAPMVALFYFMTTQHQIHVTYYMFVYYFCGNFMFGTMVYIPIGMFVDKPIQAMLNLKQDVKDAQRSQ